MEPIKNIFIGNLVMARKARGWSQQKLAAKAGLSSGAVGEIELGHGNPSLSTIEKLAIALGIPPYQLLYDTSVDGTYDSIGEAEIITLEKAQAIYRRIQKSESLALTD